MFIINTFFVVVNNQNLYFLNFSLHFSFLHFTTDYTLYDCVCDE